jgi:hypothetical protein
VCSVKCTVIYRTNSVLINPVQCVTEYRLAVSLHSAECTHMMQPAQHLQCRMLNTKTTERILNTQCTMCFRSTCQSPNTSSDCQCCLYLRRLILSIRIQTVRKSHAICHHQSALHTTHLSAAPSQQFALLSCYC